MSLPPAGPSKSPGYSETNLRAVILPAWRTNALITALLIRKLPERLYDSPVPGYPRRSVRMMVAHLHNSRCSWLRTLGEPLGLEVPPAVDPRTVSRRELARALGLSSKAMTDLLSLGCDHGGSIPPTRKYVWRNLALDVGHVLTYFVAHEAHHRGQLSLIARQARVSLFNPSSSGLWEWKPPAAGRRPRPRV